jgi:phage shock protein PspC (stress-responsive transcriptional regulator)
MAELTDDTTPIDEAPPRRLVRVDEGRWLGGVAAGLGRYFDVNPLIYRIAFAALALAGGTGLLLYLAAYLVIPGEHDEESIAVEALRDHRERPWFFVGLALLAFGALFALSEARFWPGTGNVWLAATIVGGALVWWHVSQRADRPRAAQPDAPLASVSSDAPVVPGAPAAPDERTTKVQRTPSPPRPPAKPSLFAPVLGALLAVAGLFGLLAVLDVYDIDVAAALAGGVVIVGAAIAFGAVTQRRVGGLVFLGLLLLSAFALAAVTPVSVVAGVGEKDERPATVTALESTYEHGIGDFHVDLGEITLPAGTTSVDANLGVGKLLVTVPEDVALVIDAHAGVGSIDVFGARDDGVDADRIITVPGATADAPVLDLEADVAIGDIEVRRG